jgi:hypothetical protein
MSTKQRMTQVLLYLFNQQKPWFELGKAAAGHFGFQDGNGGCAWQGPILVGICQGLWSNLSRFLGLVCKQWS